jgi:hypothetical protein
MMVVLFTNAVEFLLTPDFLFYFFFYFCILLKSQNLSIGFTKTKKMVTFACLFNYTIFSEKNLSGLVGKIV